MAEPMLKPCPFCGGEAKLARRELDERSGYNTIYTIACATCRASLSGSSRKNKMGWRDDPKGLGLSETIEAWNVRTK